MNTTLLLISGLLFLAVILALEGLYLWWNSVHGPEARRMAERVRRMSAGGHSSAADLELIKTRALSKSAGMQRLLMNLPRIGAMDRFLMQTGTDITVGSFLALTLAVFAAGFLVALVLDMSWQLALLIGAAVALIPLLRTIDRRAKRLARFESLLPEALDLIGRSMRAGHAFPSALQIAGTEMPDPAGAEFRATFDEINFGVSAQDALLNLATRMPSTDLGFFVVSVLIQRDTGGNLAEILDNISSIIRERIKLNGKVRTLSAEGRLSAVILCVIPFAVAGVFYLLNPKNMSLLWTTDFGLSLVYLAATGMVVGVIWIRNAVRIRV